MRDTEATDLCSCPVTFSSTGFQVQVRNYHKIQNMLKHINYLKTVNSH